jgi:hypothetical protein
MAGECPPIAGFLSLPSKTDVAPERKIETTKDPKVHDNQRVENLTALTFRVWIRLPSRG